MWANFAPTVQSRARTFLEKSYKYQVKKPDALTPEENEVYRNLIFPAKDQIKRVLSDIFVVNDEPPEKWRKELEQSHKSVIGQIADEMLAEKGVTSTAEIDSSIAPAKASNYKNPLLLAKEKTSVKLQTELISPADRLPYSEKKQEEAEAIIPRSDDAQEEEIIFSAQSHGGEQQREQNDPITNISNVEHKTESQRVVETRPWDGPILITTLDYVPGYKISRFLGFVSRQKGRNGRRK